MKELLIRLVPDSIYLRHRYRKFFGRKLDLKNPKTFNEKLQWLKLHDRRPIYTTMVDKYEAKGYVAGIIGEKYIIPTLGVWDSFDKIDFTSLPDQFVLKCTHDSGSVVVCKDKSSFDYSKAEKVLSDGLKHNFYWLGREWPYKNAKPRIIAEKYLEDVKTKELRDYKFLCFNGEARVLMIATDRQVDGKETKFDFFDIDFNHLHFTNGHPNSDELPSKPENYQEMVKIAEALSSGIPHVRIDLYEANGQIYFGETTFFHWSGFTPFNPEKWDEIFGSWIKLPVKRRLYE